MNSLTETGKRARAASRVLACTTTGQRNAALTATAAALEANAAAVLAENEKDLAAAKENGMIASMQDRLRLTPARISDIAEAVRDLVKLPDPVGQLIGGGSRPNGLKIEKVRVPLGVVGMIYEARPNVTVDAACLCLKSANACILRGGKEAIRSNTAFAEIMCGALEGAGLPRDGIQLVTDTSRASAGDLMTLDGYLDALIPRGGKGLIQAVVKGASVPVIETGAGNCHIYVDDSADLEMAVRVCDNAKTSRPSVCNAVETVLVHREIAAAFLPRRSTSTMSSCAAARARPPSSPASSPPPRRTTTPSLTTTSSRCGWSTASTRRSNTSSGTAPGIRRRSSPKLIRTRRSLPRASTRRPSTSTRPPALPTAGSSASARRSASPPRSCTRAGRWASMSSAPANTS